MTAAGIARLMAALLRLLLRLYPMRFRREFGHDVVAHASREVAAAPGTVAALRHATRQITCALRDLPSEHYAEWRQARPGPGAGRSGLAADFRLATRYIAAGRSRSALVVMTFALAIGAITAIFSVADAVLLRPLPYPESDRLVRLEEVTREPSRVGVSLPAVEIWSREVRSLASLASYRAATSLVIIGDEPDRLDGADSVSSSFFDVLGVQPAVGRPFTPFERFSDLREVVISHTLWQRLGGTREVLGSTIGIEPGRHTIVGVMPPGFAYPEGAQFWIAARTPGAMLREERTLRFHQAIGRLAPNATVASLQAEFDVLTERYPATHPSAGPMRMVGRGLRDTIVGEVRGGILSAGAAVALLLVVACCNITALLLAQTSARGQDRAVQLALGAAPGRMTRQQLLEVACLAVPGGLLGVLAAAAGRDTLVALSFDEVPRIAGASIDARVVLVAFGATAAAAVAATILPSWIAGRTRASTVIQAASRSTGHTRPVLRILRGVVVAQVAVTFVLAVGGGLLARTFVSLTHVDPGFEPARVHTLRINLPLTMAGKTEPQRIFYADALDRARALPGVVSAGYAAHLPLSNVFASTEISRSDDPAGTVEAAFNMASDGYLSTIGTPLVDGRDFEPSDSSTIPAVVVNEILARQLFPGGDAVGARVRIRLLGRQTEATIIGVTEAVRYDGLTAAAEPEAIVDYRVRPMILRLFVKTDGTTDDIVPMLRTAVRQADPTGRVTFDEITSLEREVARHLARPRFYLALLGAFGLTALVLSATGLYGVMSFAVEARRHDFGVRLALGASPGRIFREILRHGASLTAAGVVAGALAAYVLTGVLQALLFDITPRDATTFAGTTAVVALVALLASWLPARMARSTDPLAVMRSD